MSPTTTTTPAAPPPLEIAPHLHTYATPPAAHFAIPISHLVASAVVIHSKHVLLLQRAAHSYQALLWELPGGRCEPGDENVMYSAARELWEESGLRAAGVRDVVGMYEWLDCGEVWKKVTFLMDVESGRGGGEGKLPVVKLDPNEQAGYVWATEEDVVANKCGDIELRWTSDEQKTTVLDAFKLL